MGPPAIVKLDDALEGVTRLGLDTSPLIYFVERNPKYLDLVREIIRRVDVGEIEARSSVVTLTEVLTKPNNLATQTLKPSIVPCCSRAGTSPSCQSVLKLT